MKLKKIIILSLSLLVTLSAKILVKEILMKTKITILVFLALLTPLLAIPSWFTSNVSTEYPNYFIGKGFAQIQNKNIAEAETQAKNLALKDASSIISCKVSGETINRISEEKLDGNKKVSDYFLSEAKVKTDLKVMNYKILKSEKDGKMYYVMIGIPSTDMKNSYKFKIENSIKEISEKFKLAESLYSSNPKEAIKQYGNCISQSENLNDDLKIYLFLNKWQNDINIDELPKKSEIEKKLTILSGITPKSMDELAGELTLPMLDKQKIKFIIYPFEYENTGFVSGFGNKISELIANKIIQETKWRRMNSQKGTNYIFRGKILESDAGIHLILTMMDYRNNEQESNQIFVNRITCKNIGWNEIRPKNLKQALQNKLALYNAIQTDNRLKVNLQTDKMSDGPVVYYYGDEPKILVRANKSCYIRLMYIFSDNTKTLLTDNYHIATDQTNQWIQLPLELEVCEPSGVEQMLVQASNEKMPILNVRKVELSKGTFINIIETDIDKQIAKTRGMKLKNPQKEITEKVYQWTVFEK